jgi:hypothetical protein
MQYKKQTVQELERLLEEVLVHYQQVQVQLKNKKRSKGLFL